MAKTPFCLLLVRRRLYLSSLQQTLRSRCNSRRFSSLPPTPLPDPRKPSNLSARLSFVFDQIDAIERDRAQKDEALHRIRNWRDSKRAQRSHVDNESTFDTSKDENQRAESGVVDMGESIGVNSVVVAKKAVELVHPWPEWIELMERLVQQNYFDHKRRDEGKMMRDAGFEMGEDKVVEDQDFDFTKDLKTVQVAGLNFGKDRFDIFRSLSRQDIQILVGYGCPTTDKKVVFSAKLLRKHVHFDEGDVCSSCSLRSSCERAYLVTNKEDEARTIDIMRVLMSFGFDHVHNTVTNKDVLKHKSVKNVVRKLLHEVVKLSAVPIDPNLPPPVIKKPPPKVKQPPPPPKRRVGRDDVEMKKGDWLCTKCDFMNFAKNAVCLQCDAKRPKRQLLPGEWECPECNFLNYRRNMVCFHCECKRPHDQFMEDRLQEPHNNSRTIPDRNPRRREDVSNAWNFDFDDDESDGADVAAFEYADPRADNSDLPSEGPTGNFDSQRGAKFLKKDAEFSDFESNGRNQSGFDDFDDEDDDVDCYEVEGSTRGVNSRAFEEIERGLDFKDDSDEEIVTNRRMKSREFSDSDDDDFGSKEPSAHPDWRSSHVADSGSGGNGSSRVRSGRLSYGSDDDLEIDSGDDGYGSRKDKLVTKSGKKGFTRSNFGSDNDLPSRNRRSRFSDGSDDEISPRNPRERRGEPRGNFRGNDSRNSKSRSRFSDGSDDEISPRNPRERRGEPRGNFRGNESRNSKSRSRFSDGSDDEISHNPRGSRGTPRSNFRGNDTRNSKPRSRFSDDSDDGFSSRNPRGSRGASERRSSFRGGGSRNSKSSGSRFSDDFGDGFSRGSRGGSRGGGSSRSFRGRGEEEFGRKPRGNFGKYDQGGDAEEFKNRRRVIER